MRGTRIRTITKLLFPNHDIHMFISISHFSIFLWYFYRFFIITITKVVKVY